MNDVFDFRRFGWYARKEFSENWKAYMLGMIGYIAVIVYHIFREWSYLHSTSYKTDYVVKTSWSIVTCILLGIMIASSFVWKAFSNKKDAFSTLTLPISQLERFLFALIMAIPTPIIIGFVISKTLWGIATPLLLQDFPSLIIDPVFQNEKNMSNSQSGLYNSVLYFGSSAAFMLGAVTLGRLNILKTLGIIIAAGILYFWGLEKHLDSIFPKVVDIQMSAPFPFIAPNIVIESSKGVFSNNLVSSFEVFYRVWWCVCVPLLLYVCTFLKIKEKEL